MANKIKNLTELRGRKDELRSKLEEGFENPFANVKNVLSSYAADGKNPMALFDKSETGRNQLMDEGVKALLTLGASALVSRFKLGPVPKLLLTGAVAIATPYVVDKIQEVIREKVK